MPESTKPSSRQKLWLERAMTGPSGLLSSFQHLLEVPAHEELAPEWLILWSENSDLLQE